VPFGCGLVVNSATIRQSGFGPHRGMGVVKTPLIFRALMIEVWNSRKVRLTAPVSDRVFWVFPSDMAGGKELSPNSKAESSKDSQTGKN
jgi:hypothetical protein